MFVHRSHQKITRTAATVTGEDPSRAIRAVGRRRKSENQYTRSGIAESGNRSAPVSVVAKGGTLHPRDISAVRAKPCALVACDDVVMNLTQ